MRKKTEKIAGIHAVMSNGIRVFVPIPTLHKPFPSKDSEADGGSMGYLQQYLANREFVLTLDKHQKGNRVYAMTKHIVLFSIGESDI